MDTSHRLLVVVESGIHYGVDSARSRSRPSFPAQSFSPPDDHKRVQYDAFLYNEAVGEMSVRIEKHQLDLRPSLRLQTHTERRFARQSHCEALKSSEVL